MEKNKNRKNKKGLAIILLFLIIIAGAGAYCWYLPRVSAADESEVPVLEEGQEYAYAKITSILGNEIEYIVVDAQTMDFSDSDEKNSRRKEHSFGENINEKNGKQTQDKEGESAGELPSAGEMPDIGDMPTAGKMPDIGDMPDIASMPATGQMPAENQGAGIDRAEIQKSSTRDNTDSMQDTAIITYTETDVIGQMQIPVGTEVETKLGTITTFSRLSNGDIIKMLLQKEDAGKKALMKIWIME